ncbi:dentin matrix acidic phosphoprotein 1 [Alligator mississippiensis]|nr:dentin matrix acidic phosphoprotein 1 [Alligator mississippiensis]
MKTVLLLISLWPLTYAHPVPNHPNVHDGSSKEWRVDSSEISAALRYATSEESMNEVEDPAEKDGEDTDSSPYDSTETEGRDSIADEHEHDDILHETNEGNNYPVGVSSHSNEHHTEDLSGNDVDESITQDNDDDNSVRIKQAQHKNWVYQKDSVALEELNEHSLEDVNEFHDHEDHHTGDSQKPKQHYNTEDNGPLYKTKRFYSQKFNKEINDLIDEEDDSGDDTFDENQGDTNGKGPSYTVNPSGVDEYTAFDNGVHHRGHGDTAIRKKDSDSSSSSSSSSESRGLDSREYRNHIVSRYDRSLGNIGDSARTSHKESYDFDGEGMQGDDPSIFESEGGKSKMTRSAIHSKESSQESSREPRKAKLNGISKSVEHSNSHKFQNDSNNSGEDDSIEQDNSQSMEADEAKSGKDSQSAEDSSHSEESVASHSRKDVSRSREDVTSHSKEDVASQSSEESRESHEENEKISKEMKSKSNEYSGSKSKDRDSYEDDSKPVSIDSESAEDQGDKSKSREKSKSTEDSMESEEDKNDSISVDSRLSHSKSDESKSISRELVGSESHEDDRSEEVRGQDSKSAETYDSGSKEEEHSHSREMDSYSHSRERDSHSREDATNESTSHEDDSLPRSTEMENRKLMLDVYHNKPIGDYDDNDCQDGY